MNVFEAILIGIMQGLTEFLPVSSSGHMILLGKILGVEVSLGFELFVHLGSLLAVILVMRKSVFELIRRPLSKKMRLIFAATIPTVAIVAVFKGLFEAAFDGRWLPYCFLITAILILASGMKNRRSSQPVRKFLPENEWKIGYFGAVVVGCVQGFAALPGISRSGSTISSAVLLGSDRQSAARFSFLLSIPIIIGSAAVEIIGNIRKGVGIQVAPLSGICGFLSAFVFGYFALRFMVSKLDKYFDLFAIYLLALSIFLVLDGLFLRWI